MAHECNPHLLNSPNCKTFAPNFELFIYYAMGRFYHVLFFFPKMNMFPN